MLLIKFNISWEVILSHTLWLISTTYEEKLVFSVGHSDPFLLLDISSPCNLSLYSIKLSRVQVGWEYRPKQVVNSESTKFSHFCRSFVKGELLYIRMRWGFKSISYLVKGKILLQWLSGVIEFHDFFSTAQDHFSMFEKDTPNIKEGPRLHWSVKLVSS